LPQAAVRAAQFLARLATARLFRWLAKPNAKHEPRYVHGHGAIVHTCSVRRICRLQRK
jgi:hypothetical protein